MREMELEEGGEGQHHRLVRLIVMALVAGRSKRWGRHIYCLVLPPPHPRARPTP